jgi:hypothetical protein
MSALKNQFQRARVVIQSLVQGVHPSSGKDLPKDSIVNEVEVTRALGTAVMAIDQVSARLAAVLSCLRASARHGQKKRSADFAPRLTAANPSPKLQPSTVAPSVPSKRAWKSSVS